MGKARLFILTVLVAAAAVAGIDWMLANGRLKDISIETSLEPAAVVADGESSTTLELRVTEHGEPRANALLQLWINTGSGLLVPEWVLTDADGVAHSVYTPNVANPYDPQDEALVYVMDTTVGRIIEVDKRVLVHIPLMMPE